MCQKFSRQGTIIEFIKDLNVYLFISKNANFNSYGAFRTIFTRKGGYITFLEVDTSSISVPVLLDFSLTVKAAPHECEIRTSQP